MNAAGRLTAAAKAVPKVNAAARRAAASVRGLTGRAPTIS